MKQRIQSKTTAIVDHPAATKQRRLPRLKTLALGLVLVAISLVSIKAYRVYAESYPSGSDNGQTSRLKSLSDDLQGMGFGSTTNTPDWGSLWNRINTSARWLPTGDATAADVRLGKKFYNTSRTQQTGTLPAPGPCATQAWDDSSVAASQANNCTDSLTWTTPSPSVTGDDKLDPRTGLVWSQCLINSSGTVTFGASGCTNWSWDASNSANLAVGGKTSTQLCSERNGGGVWRQPSQKELMQAYIDGSFYNLSSPAAYFTWSSTQASTTNAWGVSLSNGYTPTNNKTLAYNVRCVR